MAGEDGSVEYPTEYMNTLANTRGQQWETDSDTGITAIRDAYASPGSFGTIPALASYGSVFAEAKKIYLETLRGAKLDLEEASLGIKDSAQKMRDKDDDAGAAFLALWSKWDNAPLESDRRHEETTNSAAAQSAATTVETAEANTPVEPGGEPGAEPGAEPGSEGVVPTDGGSQDEGAIPTGEATPAQGGPASSGGPTPS